MILKFLRKNKLLSIIIFSGALIRFLFLIYGAEIYFNRENIFYSSDTIAWQNCFENLINNGTYTVGGKGGEFSRMPGYAFFIGFFYLICGQNWSVAVEFIGWFQTFLDIFSIFLFYKLSYLIFDDQKKSLLASAFYAFYPFIIVWNPVAYSEQFSTFLMITSLIYFFKSTTRKNSKKYNLLISGLTIALASLTRPQIIPLFGILFVTLIIIENQSFRKKIIYGLYFLIPFVIIFGSWPIRNYVNHNEFIITKNAKGFRNWQEDVISFMQYTYAIKAEWDPQYTSIVKNQKTIFPSIAYSNRNDSLKLERAIHLAKNCGSGFSYKNGYWKKTIEKGDYNCNNEIARLFNELRNKQIKTNPFNFYVKVPLQNLKKAIFKNKLYDNKSIQRKVASLLFYLRTFLILTGIVGAIFSIGIKNNCIGMISLFFFISVYFILCFGTAPFMRNIEIRYFLQVDVLLLIPSSITICLTLELINKKTFKKVIRR